MEVVRCEDCIYGHRFFDVQNEGTDSWIECRNPDGLHRDVSDSDYCSASKRRCERMKVNLEISKIKKHASNFEFEDKESI